MVQGGDAGGILELFELIEEHPVEFARDLGEKFGKQPHDLGRSVRFDTAILWVRSLMADPSSWLQSAIRGWEHPVSFEGIVQMDQFDLLLQRWVPRGRYKPYPRPWPADRKRLGGKSKRRRSLDEALAILRPKT